MHRSSHSGGEPGPASPYRSHELAASYVRLAVPHHFAAPARDLVHALRLRPGALVLDVGSGTGAATIPATEIVGPRGRVVAVDPSPAMLSHARASCACLPVAGAAPRLPFADGIFDAAVASFCLSHFPDYVEGLADIARVLRPGGAIGVSAWGKMEGEHVRAWREAIAPFVEAQELVGAFRELVPWDEWFTEEQNLRQALVEAGLERVELEARAYPVAIGIDDFLALREASVEGMLLRSSLEPGRWSECRRQASELFRRRFPAGLRYTRPASLALARKTG